MRTDSDMRPDYMRQGFYVGEIRVYKGHSLLYTEKDIPLKATLYTAKLVLEPNPDNPDCIQDFTIHLVVMLAKDSPRGALTFSFTVWRRWDYESGIQAYKEFKAYICKLMEYNATMYAKGSEGA